MSSLQPTGRAGRCRWQAFFRISSSGDVREALGRLLRTCKADGCGVHRTRMNGGAEMTRGILVIVAVLFVFALTSVSLADSTKATVNATDTDKDKDKKKKKTSSAKKIKEVSGVVTSVNTTAKNVTVQGITIAANERMLSDIRVGDRVMVKYVTRGRHEAVIIIRQ